LPLASNKRKRDSAPQRSGAPGRYRAVSGASCILFFKGHSSHSKQKVTDPYVVGWFLGGQKKYQGWSDFFRDFFIVFLNSPHRETPKNVIKKNRETTGFGIFLSIFG
jgi:hypothetical protein